ncbi:hypothetical protein BCR34DRAFT_294855 [Clohesyomyces aquaticus]|uniref:Uncharacterized protein n=1 Tax=Clohesyomyces aquaticus TaxID=1231657 RepID=A0A1Y2A8G1_9PLEO|nr:hypothetical protein BCR34DRAFT_294855 [Clohesyomyces aquaticus]
MPQPIPRDCPFCAAASLPLLLHCTADLPPVVRRVAVPLANPCRALGSTFALSRKTLHQNRQAHDSFDSESWRCNVGRRKQLLARPFSPAAIPLVSRFQDGKDRRAKPSRPTSKAVPYSRQYILMYSEKLDVYGILDPRQGSPFFARAIKHRTTNAKRSLKAWFYDPTTNHI